VEVRAAVAVVELSLRAVEMGNLVQRIEELEALAKGTRADETPSPPG
jgi:hypothetical protein